MIERRARTRWDRQSPSRRRGEALPIARTASDDRKDLSGLPPEGGRHATVPHCRSRPRRHRAKRHVWYPVVGRVRKGQTMDVTQRPADQRSIKKAAPTREAEERSATVGVRFSLVAMFLRLPLSGLSQDFLHSHSTKRFSTPTLVMAFCFISLIRCSGVNHRRRKALELVS